MKNAFIFFSFTLVLHVSPSLFLLAQPFTFFLTDSIEVYEGEQKLSNAWAGGLNSVQLNALDVNEDDEDDLVLYDRTNDKLFVYLNEGGQYVYAPYFEVGFPEVNFWLLLRDYNGDGLKDIFTGTSAGIKVYKNLGFLEGKLSWELVADPVRTLGFSESQINLKVDITDIPGIVDIDNDGDLDIFTVLPSIGGSIEFHKNLSIESFDNSDSLLFEKVTDKWGGIVECGNCTDYFFDNGASCRTKAVKHAGSTILLFDADNDGDKELVWGESDCTHLTYFENKGNVEEAFFDSFDFNFPAGESINMLFPSAFIEDIDLDGTTDVILSPNLFANEAKTEDFGASVWRYEKSDVGGFQLLERDFLQKNMIELGEGANPAVADEDGDGDLDLFVSNKGRPTTNTFVASISLFENEGDNDFPSFRLKTDDYLNLSKFAYQELKIQLVDMNGDDKKDLVYTAVQPGTPPAIRYLLNLSDDANSQFSFSTSQIKRLDIDISRLDEAHFVDINQDGSQDLLLGKNTGGELLYFRNTSDAITEGFVFDESVNGFGGITFNNLKRELSIETADLDENGKLDLITGDRSGSITIYPDFQDNLNSNFAAIGDTILNPDRNEFVQYDFGSGVYPAVFNKDIIVGTETGGLMYLRHNTEKIISANPKVAREIDLNIYPNPTQGYFHVDIPLNGNLDIFNIQGVKIGSYIKRSNQKRLTISMNDSIPDGLYYIRFSGGGKLINRKIIVKR